jgi:hypothetical protein
MLANAKIQEMIVRINTVVSCFTLIFTAVLESISVILPIGTNISRVPDNNAKTR